MVSWTFKNGQFYNLNVAATSKLTVCQWIVSEPSNKTSYVLLEHNRKNTVIQIVKTKITRNPLDYNCAQPDVYPVAGWWGIPYQWHVPFKPGQICDLLSAWQIFNFPSALWTHFDDTERENHFTLKIKEYSENYWRVYGWLSQTSSENEFQQWLLSARGSNLL